MQEPDQNIGANDRRMYPRCSVYGFMHAVATLSDSSLSGQQNQDEMTRYCTGLLADISHEGAQINMPGDCRKYLKENQGVTVRIKTTFTEKLDFDVQAHVKYIVCAKNTDGLLVGVEFAELRQYPRVQAAVARICELGRKLKAVSAAQAEQTTSAKN